MSYLVLARKWRPQTFDQVVGQGAVVRTLRNAIERKRVAHAMIFSGVRGVGKTTLARIMAKALICESADQPPCDACSSCLEIRKGIAIDLHEIDGASNRGIQEIRELKENIRFQPTKARYKIIIIDEVHMLTNEAFNALLKTLEEPPEHVFFMFATTELHKVPVTILSRCQRYELKRVSFKELYEFFGKIAAREEVEISDAALGMIAREAGGSVRDGLSLLDQVFAFGGEKITEEDVGLVLGLVDSQVYGKIAAALLEKDLAKSLALVGESFAEGVDLKRFATDLLGYFRSLLVAKINLRSNELLDLPDQDLESLRDIAEKQSVETLSNILHVLLKSVEEMQYSTHPRMSLEMAFVKITAAGDLVSVGELLSRLGRLTADGSLGALASAGPNENGFGGGGPGGVGAGKETPPEKKYRHAPVMSAEEPAVLAGTEEATIKDNLAKEEVKDMQPSLPSEAEPPRTENCVQVEAKDVRKHWDGFLEHVKDRKAWMAHSLSLCTNVREADGKLVVKYDDVSDCRVLQERDNIKLLNEYALDFFQKDLRVSIIAKSGSNVENSSGDQGLPQEERKALGNDPLVQLTAEILGGRVSGIRTGPRSR